MSLKSKTISGVLWNFSELIMRRGMAVITTLILAWFLSPEDFGLLAMMTVFLAFSDVLVDAGLSQALIRKKTITSRELNTAFFTNLLLATIAYATVLFCAPLIAQFYDEPRLVSLLRVAGISILFNALNVIQQVILYRALKFKLQLKVTLPAAVLSGLIAIICAYSGFGVWSLVAQLTSQSILTALFYLHLRLWRPHLEFGLRELIDLFSFGGYLLLAQLSHVPFKNMYVLVIAKVYTSAIAGLYFFTEKIRDLVVNQLVSSVQKVTYPALSQLQGDDEKLKRGYREVISVTAFVLFPALMGLAAFADIIFELFLPDNWIEAAPYLQLMCFASLLAPVHSVNMNILKVRGRSDLVFFLGIIKKTTAIAIFSLTYRLGLEAIIIGQIISSILSLIPNCYYSKKLINYSVLEQLKDYVPTMLLAACISLSAWFIQLSFNLNPAIELISLSVLSATIYIYLAWFMKLNGLNSIKKIIQQMMTQKSSNLITH